ncbi:NAD(P)H-binding protein [Paenibacillus pasadenensis]|uniref:NmrA family NAD(P)-binding protein n=1 Tax=Paenibacillus pasadenensis TaxID=217090 RepID=UPI00203CB5A3|nr:NmrA family NAD(P)-binding protein [Paenibacillus pasadenensis]MCM3750272.1 NAD(P)H-binding protein [Paenibacillus pasadenensis]
MTILVTGASGNVGRYVVEHLVGAGQQVRALTRHPERTDFPEGVEVVYGDLAVPESLAPAFNGVTAMHLITFNSDGYGPLQTGPEIVELAEKAGVRRVTVLWSGVNGPVEQAVEASGLEWTFLQPAPEFMSNALVWVDSIREEGIVSEPFQQSLDAMVHPSDIGSVAATALIHGGHAGQTYNITGPEVLTIPQKVRTISAVLGKEIKFVELTEEQARERMRKKGAQEDVIDFVIGWHANPPQSAYTVVPTVEQITGRPAKTFAQWVSEHGDRFKS